jgi:hypothetical protein
MLMRVRITHVLERTIDLYLDTENESAAVAVGLQIASDIQPADWDYSRGPIHQEGFVLIE